MSKNKYDGAEELKRFSLMKNYLLKRQFIFSVYVLLLVIFSKKTVCQ